IHAVGALADPAVGKIIEMAAESEAHRLATSRLALHATDLELAARSKDVAARLEAIADAVCEAPVRSTIERLATAARDPAARAALAEPPPADAALAKQLVAGTNLLLLQNPWRGGDSVKFLLELKKDRSTRGVPVVGIAGAERLDALRDAGVEQAVLVPRDL